MIKYSYEPTDDFEEISSTHDWNLIKEFKSNMPSAELAYYECSKCSMIAFTNWISYFPVWMCDVTKQHIISLPDYRPPGEVEFPYEWISLTCDEFTLGELRLKMLIR